ncbi:MAG: hypothetical protein JWO59_1961 [Chloroflexi bacterium]|nr:hypothetical protein [Chloroflexota bacterium]
MTTTGSSPPFIFMNPQDTNRTRPQRDHNVGGTEMEGVIVW